MVGMGYKEKSARSGVMRREERRGNGQTDRQTDRQKDRQRWRQQESDPLTGREKPVERERVTDK